MTIVTAEDHKQKLYSSVKKEDRWMLQSALQRATHLAGETKVNKNVTVKMLKAAINFLKSKVKNGKLDHTKFNALEKEPIKRRGGGIAKRGFGIAK